MAQIFLYDSLNFIRTLPKMYYFKYICLFLFVISVADVHARLGESEEELARRYGKPIKQDGRIFFYTKNGFFLKFFVEEYGYAKTVEIYKEKDTLDADEIKLFMERNGMEEIVDLGHPDSTIETETHKMKLFSEGSFDQLNAERSLERRHMWGAKWEGLRSSDFQTMGMIAAANASGDYKYHAIYDKNTGRLLIWMNNGLTLYEAYLKKNIESKAKSQLEGF